jgi:hypothetical protein
MVKLKDLAGLLATLMAFDRLAKERHEDHKVDHP